MLINARRRASEHEKQHALWRKIRAATRAQIDGTDTRTYRFAVNSRISSFRELHNSWKSVTNEFGMSPAGPKAYITLFFFLLRSVNSFRNFSPPSDLNHENSIVASIEIKHRPARQNSIQSRVTCVTSQTNRTSVLRVVLLFIRDKDWKVFKILFFPSSRIFEIFRKRFDVILRPLAFGRRWSWINIAPS